MKRRAVITTGSMVLIAGCASSTPDTGSKPTGNAGNTTTNTTNTTSDTGSESTPDEESQTVVKIEKLSAGSEVKQGDSVTVSATINSTTTTTVTATLTNETGSQISSTSVSAAPDSEEVLIRLTVSPDTPPGNSTLQLTAEAGGISDQAATSVRIVEFVPEWKQLFNDAVSKVEAGLDEIAAAGSESDDRTILDTTISSGYTLGGAGKFSEADSLAFDALEEIENNPDARARIDRLRLEINWVADLPGMQKAVCDLFSMLESRFGNGDTARVDTSLISSTKDEYDAFSDRLSEIEPVVGENYQAKLKQIEAEISAVEGMVEPANELITARSNFENKSYSAAANRAEVAQSGFDSVISDIDSPTDYPPEDSVDEEFVSLIEDWKEVAVDLQSRAATKQAEIGY